MDFVVVGLGLGTLAILTGVLLFSWMAGRWERAASQAALPEEVTYDHAMAATRRGAGQALIGAGVAVLIATIGGLAGSLDDQTGAFLVTTAVTVAACGLLVWAYLYRTRNPLPPRRRSSPVDTASMEPAPARRMALPAFHARAAKQPANEALDNDEESSDSGNAAAIIAPRERAVAAPAIDVPSEALSNPASLAKEAPDPRDDGDEESDVRAVIGLAVEELSAAADAIEREPDPGAGDERNDRSAKTREQGDPALNGATDDPFALHEEELEEEWKVRRDRKT